MRKTRSAFTLVELLVVIGIIAMLIAILLPSLAKARQSAQTITCASNLRQVGLAFLQYRDDNRDFFAPWIYDYAWGWTSPSSNPVTGRWYNYLEPYTQSYTIFNCPTYSVEGIWGTQLGENTRVVNNNQDGAPWMVRGRSLAGGTCNYSYNGANIGGVIVNGTGPGWMRKYSRTVQMLRSVGKGPNEAIVAMDGLFVLLNRDGYVPNSNEGLLSTYRYIHSKKANVLFLDSHVEPCAATELDGQNPAGYWVFTRR